MLEPCSSCFPICFCNWQAPTHRKVKVTFQRCKCFPSVHRLSNCIPCNTNLLSLPCMSVITRCTHPSGILQLVHGYTFGATIRPCLSFVRLLILLPWSSIAWIWVTLVHTVLATSWLLYRVVISVAVIQHDPLGQAAKRSGNPQGASSNALKPDIRVDVPRPPKKLSLQLLTREFKVK